MAVQVVYTGPQIWHSQLLFGELYLRLETHPRPDLVMGHVGPGPWRQILQAAKKFYKTQFLKHCKLNYVY